MKYKIVDNFLNKTCFDYLSSLNLQEVKSNEILSHHNQIFKDGKIKVTCISPEILNNLQNRNLTEKDKDAFKIMGLELNAEWSIIHKKFKTLVKKFHPDKNLGNKQFEDKLKKITLAYSHLKIITTRK